MTHDIANVSKYYAKKQTRQVGKMKERVLLFDEEGLHLDNTEKEKNLQVFKDREGWYRTSPRHSLPPPPSSPPPPRAAQPRSPCPGC